MKKRLNNSWNEFWGEVCLWVAPGFFLVIGVYLCGYLGGMALWNCYENDPSNTLKISLLSLLVVFSLPIGFFSGLPWYILARKLLGI